MSVKVTVVVDIKCIFINIGCNFMPTDRKSLEELIISNLHNHIQYLYLYIQKCEY